MLQLSEEAWCYWLCYSTLNSETQQEAKIILSACTGLLPNYDKLLSLYFFIREDDIAFQHLILTAEEKYNTDEEKLHKALIEIALNYCKRFSNKAAIARRIRDIMNYHVTLSPADWSVLLTYEHLCDNRKISEAGKFVLSTIGEGANLQRGCPIELAKYFEGRFKDQIEEREENELEQFLLSNEETE